MIKIHHKPMPEVRAGATVEMTGRDEQVAEMAMLLHLSQVLAHTVKHDSHIFLTHEEHNVLTQLVADRQEFLGRILEAESQSLGDSAR